MGKELELCDHTKLKQNYNGVMCRFDPSHSVILHQDITDERMKMTVAGIYAAETARLPGAAQIFQNLHFNIT